MMHSGTWTTLLSAAALLLPGAQAVHQGTFDILTYNVAGLPEPLSSSQPIKNTPLISSRLGNFSIVHVQEDFNYHKKLYASAPHQFRTETSGPVPIGSGLNTLSDYPFTDLKRVKWDDCYIGTGDCLTPKGFTAMRITLAPGVQVDFYNLHADAGSADGDYKARQKEYKQLVDFINTYSAGNAIVLAGDTNTRYTSEPDPIRLLNAAPASLTDVWVQLKHHGTPPAAGSPSVECPFPMPDDRTDCELIDKVFYRSSPLVRLTATDYFNRNTAFLRDDGAPLSDHYPVAVPFAFTSSAALRDAATSVGQPVGRFFNDLALYPRNYKIDDARARAFVKEIAFRAGKRVDQISYVMNNGIRVSRGGFGGEATETLVLADGETVNEVEMCKGTRPWHKGGDEGVGYVRVKTRKGRELEAGEREEGVVCEVVQAEDGWGLAGFYGNEGTEVDKLGVYWGKL